MLRIFWCNPALMDYRKPLFDRFDNKYKVKFFFQTRTSISSDYNAVYAKDLRSARKLALFVCAIIDLPQLWRGIKESDVFISSFLSDPYSLIGILLARLLHKKTVIWEEISYFFPRFRFRILYCVMGKAAAHVDAFFVCGEPHRHALEELGVPSEKTFVANEYPGHVYSEIIGTRIEGLDISGPKVVFLYLGRFVPVKGIRYLLEAYVTLEKEHPECLLLLAGHGPLEKDLMKYARTARIRNIAFLGPRYDIHEKKYLFQTSTALVVPSIIDPTGNSSIEGDGPIVILEALSAGTPVLVTDGCPTGKQFVRDEINGFVVPHSDPRALSTAMAQLMAWKDDPGVRGRVIAEFRRIKGYDYQFEQFERAIMFSLRSG